MSPLGQSPSSSGEEEGETKGECTYTNSTNSHNEQNQDVTDRNKLNYCQLKQ